MYRAVLCAIFLLGCAGLQLPDNRITIGRTISEQAQAAVEIKVLCPNGDVFGGSGVMIENDALLTAAHVVTCMKGPESADWTLPLITLITMYDGTERIAVSIDAKVDVDLARVFLLPSKDYRIRRVIFGGPVYPEDKVCFEHTVPSVGRSCGKVLPEIARKPGDIRHDAKVVGGNSGSGMYNERGELVAIVVTAYLFRVGGGATSLW